MIDLERSLRELGPTLDQRTGADRDDIVGEILTAVRTPTDPAGPADAGARPDARRAHRTWHRRLALAAACVVIAVAVAAIALPDARRTVAEWLGLRNATIERRIDLDVPDTPDPIALPGPGSSAVIEVDGADVLVSSLTGAFDEQLLDKTVGQGTTVESVDVLGAPGYWIDGNPHELLYLNEEGSVVRLERRVAGPTLLWQDGDVLHRIEGLDDLDAALALASKLSS